MAKIEVNFLGVDTGAIETVVNSGDVPRVGDNVQLFGKAYKVTSVLWMFDHPGARLNASYRALVDVEALHG